LGIILNKIAKYSNNAKIIPIIKANGYGHGIIEIAKNLNSPRIAMLGVAFAEEALMLRDSGEIRNILIIVPPEIEEIEELLNNDITFTLGRLELLPKINEIAKKLNKVAKIHIFINTGMNRDGITPEEMSINGDISQNTIISILKVFVRILPHLNFLINHLF